MQSYALPLALPLASPRAQHTGVYQHGLLSLSPVHPPLQVYRDLKNDTFSRHTHRPPTIRCPYTH
eukprot:5948553-Prymnesium_polylepis.2